MKHLLNISILIMVISSCTQQNTINEKADQIEVQDTLGPQSIALLDKKNQFEQKADETTKKIYAEGLDAILESGILETAKNTGDLAPNFSLTNALGDTVTLYDELQNGPVVLVWYRGGWCPYCNINLHHLQEELPNFKAHGASMIAISPELPDNSLKTIDKHQLKYEVLSDIGNKVAETYGVVFKLTREVAEIYNNKFGLNEYNGDTSNTLPLAATYIIRQDKKIEYAFLDIDYRNRAEPAHITSVLRKLNK